MSNEHVPSNACPKCNGTGNMALLLPFFTCDACGGSGQVVASTSPPSDDRPPHNVDCHGGGGSITITGGDAHSSGSSGGKVTILGGDLSSFRRLAKTWNFGTVFNTRLHSTLALGSLPSIDPAGSLHLDTSSNTLRFHTGTTWVVSDFSSWSSAPRSWRVFPCPSKNPWRVFPCSSKNR